MPVVEIDWREAEALVGERVDRRRSYARDGKKLLELCRWVWSCSGCFEAGEGNSNAHNYPWDRKAQCHIGSGCSECGYHGKVRRAQWVPFIRAEHRCEIDES